jgi:phosphohistidine phosphatase SixA
MGKLYLIRHGESIGQVWYDAYKNDACNFLSPYGVQQAQFCGAYLKRREITFGHVVSSNLTRARQTTSHILQELDDWQRTWSVVPEFNELVGSTRVTECVEAFKALLIYWDGHGNLMVVTHYHVMQQFFKALDIDVTTMHGQGKIIYNAVPYVWDPEDPKKIEMTDLFSPRYNMHPKE